MERIRPRLFGRARYLGRHPLAGRAVTTPRVDRGHARSRAGPRARRRSGSGRSRSARSARTSSMRATSSSGDYILPALQAGALYEDRYPLATALGRPLVAKRLVEIARMERATAVAHGCTRQGQRSGAPRRRPSRALDPSLKIIAPARCGTCRRAEKSNTPAPRNLPVPHAGGSVYSIDANLWGRSIDCGVPRGSVGRAARGDLPADPGAAGVP